MSTQSQHDEAQASYELRVLEGAQRGAATAVPGHRSFDIGSLFADEATHCDVQLRDLQIGNGRIRVLPRGAQPPQVQVLAGEVLFGDQRLTVGSRAEWPLYAPLRLGGSTLALGEPGSMRWHEPGAPPPAASAPAPKRDEARINKPRRNPLERWLAIGGSALALAAVALMSLVAVLRPSALVTDTSERTVQQLLARNAGFDRLRVEPGPVVRGVVDTAERVQALRRLLASAGLESVRIDVGSTEQLAAAVVDVFRVQGIAAETQADTEGKVTVRTQELDPNKLARAATQARRDVPGLAELVLANHPPAAPPQDVPVIDDPGKRVASIVPGDSPYVATADGTRYFIGALLPTGHRIEAIERRRVVLAKDGHESELSF